MEQEKDTWLPTYCSSLDQEISTSINYLNTTINWAISLIIAIILFLVNRKTYPDRISWVCLSAALILVSHFASRSGKAYISVMRFFIIQRSILGSLLKQIDSAEYGSYIRKYHIEWQSPIPFRTVIYKLLLELGYGYLYLLIFAVKLHIAVSINIDYKMIISISICTLISIGEFYLLKVSPYLKNIRVDHDALRLR